MSVKDLLLALCVVIAWGVNFVVIKVGLHDMPPFLLAALRFTLVALPAIFFVPRPKVPLRWLALYGLTISFGQFAFLFLSLKLGMPAGLASLVLQAQAFFTLLFGALMLAETLRWHHITGIVIASGGMFLLATTAHGVPAASGVTLTTMLLTLAAALCWGMGNITNKVIMRNGSVPVMSLVVWSALIPVGPFLLCSWLFEGPAAIAYSLVHIRLQTLLVLVYLAFFATIIGYGIWGKLLSRYETWRVAPLSLLVPVVGIFSAALLLDETLSLRQVIGAMIIVIGLVINVFGGRFMPLRTVRAQQD
jgi:O-acetylserine/cysteine efflux transporter